MFAQEDAEKAAKDTVKVTEKGAKKAAKETKDAVRRRVTQPQMCPECW